MTQRIGSCQNSICLMSLGIFEFSEEWSMIDHADPGLGTGHEPIVSGIWG